MMTKYNSHSRTPPLVQCGPLFVVALLCLPRSVVAAEASRSHPAAEVAPKEPQGRGDVRVIRAVAKREHPPLKTWRTSFDIKAARKGAERTGKLVRLLSENTPPPVPRRESGQGTRYRLDAVEGRFVGMIVVGALGLAGAFTGLALVREDGPRHDRAVTGYSVLLGSAAVLAAYGSLGLFIRMDARRPRGEGHRVALRFAGSGFVLRF